MTIEMGTTEAALTTYLRLQRHVGGCREWMPDEAKNCWAPAEYVLWGKLIPAEGLGPRCYDHAAKHIGHHALVSRSNFALINLRDLAVDINKSTEPVENDA